ncbi:MAG: type II toxin-antitoxin system VapC family toxin [Armatimonadota bacterium]
MIFLDTTGFYALTDETDAYHQRAIDSLAAASLQGKTFITQSYVVVESAALLHRRLGYDVARQFLHDVEAFEIVWVDDSLHHAAVQAFESNRSRGISFVDAVSFELMRQQGIIHFIGYDRHFENEGFRLYHP